MRELAEKWSPVSIAAPSVAVLIVGMRSVGLLQLGEWEVWDNYWRWRPLEPKDPHIVIVTIDEPDIKHVGQWPMTDGQLAQLIKNIKEQEPRAIGMDLYRDLAVEPGHQQLVEVFKSTPNLIGIQKVVGNVQGRAVEPPPLLGKLNQIGAADLVIDADGKIRRGLLSLKQENGETIYGLGLRLALMYLEGSGIELYAVDGSPGKVGLGQAVFVPFQKNDGGYVDADDGGYQIVLNFRGPLENFHSISLTDVLKNNIPADLMRDRIVLIGANATSLNDLFYTPYNSRTRFDRTPGVVIHANIISQIVLAATEGRSLIKSWSEPMEWLWIFIWSGLGAILAWKLPAMEWIAGICLVLGASLVLSTYLAFLQGWWIPVVPPLLALTGSVVALGGYIVNMERRERQMLMNLFGRNVSPKIADAIWQDRHKLLEEGRLAGHHLTATVLFADLKGFGAIAEQMDPTELMSWLNEYMNTMADIVFQYDGVVDKFIGDQVMAVFGVPIPRTEASEIALDAIAAVSCARQMGRKLRQLNQQWRSSGLPNVAMHIGIATGTVVAGSLGSRQRLNYTTLGDTVNIAAALERYDKSKHGGVCLILVSPETYFYIQKQFPTQIIGTISLKGRSQPLKIHQVLLDDCQS